MSAVAVVVVLPLEAAGYLVNVIVHLVGHFFELVVSQAEVSLVWVEVSILPAALSLSLIHSTGQVEGCLESLRDGKENCFFLLGKKTTTCDQFLFKATICII